MTVEFNGKKMQYFTFGTGKKNFVIIPGMALHSVMEAEGSVKKDYERFTDEYTIWLFERTENIPDGYTCRDMARDTAEAMKVLEISDACIFGASQGAMISFCLAVDYPELVHKIVAGSAMTRPNEVSDATFTKWLELAEKCEVTALNHDFFDRVYSDEFKEKYAAALKMLEPNGTPEECARFTVLAKAAMTFSIYDELDKVKCPVLIIGSARDRVLSGEASVEAAEKLGCEIYMYQGYGHAVYDEAPDYKDRIADFFAK